jgi:HPt (histidine-containing phosphotransfer) domain-containing protein
MNESLLNIEIILEILALSDDLDENLFADIFLRFKNDLPIYLSKMHAAIETGDFASLEFQAHALRGQADLTGARSVALACETLERAAQNHFRSGLNLIVEIISTKANETLPVLESFLQEQHRRRAA